MRWYLVLAVCLGALFVLACSGSDPYAGEWFYDRNANALERHLGTAVVYEWPEDDHCDFAPLLLLTFSAPDGERIQFVRAERDDPPGIEVSGFITNDVDIPLDARHTGHFKGDAKLLVTPELNFVWIVSDSGAERWPRQDPQIACG